MITLTVAEREKVIANVEMPVVPRKGDLLVIDRIKYVVEEVIYDIQGHKGQNLYTKGIGVIVKWA